MPEVRRGEVLNFGFLRANILTEAMHRAALCQMKIFHLNYSYLKTVTVLRMFISQTKRLLLHE